MSWWVDHKSEILVGTIVAIMASAIIATVVNFSVVSHAVIVAIIHFRYFAYNVPGGGWAVPFFLLAGMLFWVYWPLVGTAATVYWFFDPHPRSRLYRNEKYEEALAAFLTVANTLEGKRKAKVPEDVKRQLVEVLRLVEMGVAEIIGPRRRSAFRMLWLVRLGDDPNQFKVWAHTKDQLGRRERAIVEDALTKFPEWIAGLDHPERVYRETPPERFRSFLSIRNLNSWRVAFVIAFDRRVLLSRATKERLMSHLMTIMPLWEIAVLQRIVVQLTQENWEGAASYDQMVR